MMNGTVGTYMAYATHVAGFFGVLAMLVRTLRTDSGRWNTLHDALALAGVSLYIYLAVMTKNPEIAVYGGIAAAALMGLFSSKERQTA